MSSPAATSLLEAIGDTPLVRLQKLPAGGSAAIWIKLEYYNPTGSYKDRMALAMIEGAEKRGDLRPGMSVVEYTGGNTGSALAMICAIKGYPLKVVTSDVFSSEKTMTMAALGAEIILVPSDGGKITADLFSRMTETAESLATEKDCYYTNQMSNPDNSAGYEALGIEIAEQLSDPIDIYCAAVGSAGMLMGSARGLRKAGSRARIVAFEPASAAFLSTGTGGTHRVEGIGLGYRVPLLDDALFDEVRAIEEVLARETARRLAREEGIFSGTSTGLNVAGALALGKELGPGKTIVTVAVDSGLKYLAGDLFRD